MRKEDIFRAFISDPIVFEKGYLTKEQSEKIRITEATENIFVDVFKIIINNKDEDKSDLMILNAINKYLKK